MATSKAGEFRGRLARWKEEYAAGPEKTEITPQLIKQLETLISVVERIERDLNEAEAAVIEFLNT